MIAGPQDSLRLPGPILIAVCITEMVILLKYVKIINMIVIIIIIIIIIIAIMQHCSVLQNTAKY